eukprot:1150478-Pelagomonas_calceolata.AAC.13
MSGGKEAAKVKGAGGVEERADDDEGGRGQDCAVGLGAWHANVHEPHLAYQMRRDLNAAWNLWEVLAAECAGQSRPCKQAAAQPPGP